MRKTNGCNKVPHIKPGDFSESAFVFHWIDLHSGTLRSLELAQCTSFEYTKLRICPACDPWNPILLSDGNYKLDHFASRGKTQSKVKTEFFGSQLAKDWEI